MRATGVVVGRPIGRTVLIALGAALALVALAGASAAGRPVIAIGVAGCIAMSTAVVTGLVSWRVPVWGLLLWIPVSGIPILATYPHTGPAVLLKDFFFVAPAYLGFALELIRRRVVVTLPVVPAALLTMFAVLVCLQALNPALPNHLVGAIGVKTWLWYIPLGFLGYHLVRDRRDLVRLLGAMSIAAVGPLVLGIVEAALLRFGARGTVSSLYGDAAAVATGKFTELQLPSGSVVYRVPSTFSSWTQYFGFGLSMCAISYAWWRSGRGHSRWRVARMLVWVAAVVATITSGARVAFLAVPVLIVLTLALEQAGRSRGAEGVRRLGPRIGAVVALLVVVAFAAGGIFTNVLWKARHELGFTFLHRFNQALHVTVFGLGTGIDTIASRYAAAPEVLFAAFGGVWYESWVVKVTLELGVPGLILVTVLVVEGLRRLLRAHLSLSDAALRAISAALLAFILVNVPLAFSKPFIDYDPINVLIPLAVGWVARIATLEREVT